jgi:Mn2+/Fe2+ NRAMP family transporter
VAERTTVGWREVLLVAVAVVGVVLGLAIGTSLLPADAQRLVFRTPLLIGVLIVGTAVVLVRLVRRPPNR